MVHSEIRNFLKIAPDAQFNLRVGNTEQVITDLRRFQSDIGLIEGICNDSQIISQPWRKDNLVIIANPDHPLCKKTNITFDDLLAQNWALREPGSGTRDTFEKAMRQYGGQTFTLSLAIELAHTEALKRIIQVNYFLGCISEFAVQREIERGDLVVLSTPFLNLERTLYLLTRAGQTLSPLMETFRNFCLTQSVDDRAV